MDSIDLPHEDRPLSFFPPGSKPDKSKENNIRYSVYTYENVSKEQNTYFSYPMIVQKNRYGLIVQFTRLADYLRPKGFLINSSSDWTEKKLYMVTRMLNYIIYEMHDTFHADTVFDITYDMMQTYFQTYATTTTIYNELPTDETVKRTVLYCTEFMSRLYRDKNRPPMHVTDEELWESHDPPYNHYSNSTKPRFKVLRPAMPNKKPFRDMPRKILPLFMQAISRFAPDIAFGCVVQMTAGLRTGEVCNMRQEGSCYGPGIKIESVYDRILDIEIDLSKEYPLRDDGVRVGGIKKERTAHVYPAFIPLFKDAYETHKSRILRHVTIANRDIAPMFVDSNGYAMTDEAYRRRFQEVADRYFIPELIASSDHELHLYGQKYAECGLDCHILRHVFSVEIAMRSQGSVAELQNWRGDKNPESAYTYLQNKSELQHVLEENTEKLIADAMKEIRI